MADSPRFTVPKRNVLAFQALASLDGDSFDKILDVLEARAPLNSVAAIQAGIADSGSLPEAEARRIVIALVGLFNLHTLHSWDLEQVVRVASESVELELDGVASKALASRIESIFRLTDFQLIAKAVDVAGQHANNVHVTRILTDVRPVFAEGESESIGAAIVSQTIVLRYFDDSGSERTFFAKIGEQQLRDLRSQIDRGFEKARAVHRLFEIADTRIIQEEG